MTERLDLGRCPWGESCAQVGTNDYYPRARRECRAFIQQLQRMFRPEPDGARLVIRSNPHDFGDYLSVVCEFDPAVQAAVDYACSCEGDGPQDWDDQARMAVFFPKEVSNGNLD